MRLIRACVKSYASLSQSKDGLEFQSIFQRIPPAYPTASSGYGGPKDSICICSGLSWLWWRSSHHSMSRARPPQGFVLPTVSCSCEQQGGPRALGMGQKQTHQAGSLCRVEKQPTAYRHRGRRQPVAFGVTSHNRPGTHKVGRMSGLNLIFYASVSLPQGRSALSISNIADPMWILNEVALPPSGLNKVDLLDREHGSAC